MIAQLVIVLVVFTRQPGGSKAERFKGRHPPVRCGLNRQSLDQPAETRREIPRVPGARLTTAITPPGGGPARPRRKRVDGRRGQQIEQKGGDHPVRN